MKASPFLVPFSAARIRMNATSVIGSRVIASPMIIRLSTTSTPPSRPAANALGALPRPRAPPEAGVTPAGAG
jgi:hypothetical protein